MQLSRKQVILISVISGVILLLTLAAVLIFTPGEEDAAPESTASPRETDSPTATPQAATPAPTTFLLPLVPQWDTPQPAADAEGTGGVFAPDTLTPSNEALILKTVEAWTGPYEKDTKDIWAVGLQNGRAAALLLLRLGEGTLTVLALPAKEGISVSGSLREQGELTAALAEAWTGCRCGAWLALDLQCLPAVLQITGPLGEGEISRMADGSARSETLLPLIGGAAVYVQRMSLWMLPSLKRAVGEGFASSLSARELWGLFWAVRRGVTVQGLLLPETDMTRE